MDVCVLIAVAFASLLFFSYLNISAACPNNRHGILRRLSITPTALRAQIRGSILRGRSGLSSLDPAVPRDILVEHELL